MQTVLQPADVPTKSADSEQSEEYSPQLLHFMAYRTLCALDCSLCSFGRNMNNPIPLIDLNGPSTTEELAQQIADAVASIGFLHLRGFGITPQEVKRIFDISHELFNSPVSERLACRVNELGNGHSAYKSSVLAESAALSPDLKENFSFGCYYPPATSTEQQLPPVLQAHREEMVQFQRKCWEASARLLDAFSLALGLPKEYFRERHSAGLTEDPQTHQLRLQEQISRFRVQARTRTGALSVSSPAQGRKKGHSDTAPFAQVTLLFQEENGTPGLEVFVPTGDSETEGKWFPAPIVPDTVLVNVGAAMEHWTSGVYKATLHRVVLQPSADGTFPGRKSIAFFVQADPEVMLNPVGRDGIITQEGGMSQREFFAERVRKSKAVAA